jgi:hypothetical protein
MCLFERENSLYSLEEVHMSSIAAGPVIIQTSAESAPAPPCLYVKILIGSLKQGLSRLTPAQEDCWGKAPPFTRLDR